MMFAKENGIGQLIIKTVQCFTGLMPRRDCWRNGLS